MTDKRTIKSHVAGHGIWKARLRDGIASGGHELDADHIRPDDRCAFGKWLHGMRADEQASTHYQEVRELHRQFHLQAAHIVELIQAGRTAEAEGSLQMLGDFSRASSQLTRAMYAWMEA